MVSYFAMATRYIRIKQRHLMMKLGNLSTLIHFQASHQLRMPSYTQKMMFWTNYKRMQEEICQLYQEISGLNAFWSKYLTLLFTLYVIEVVYIAYSIMFVPSDFAAMRLIFTFVGVEFIVLLLVITWHCSEIIKMNLRMERNLNRNGVLLQKIFQFRIGDILKIDSMAMNYKNISKISFKLMDVYRINSEMFEIVSAFLAIF